MKDLLVLAHMGMGDAIMLNGAIRILSKKHRVIFPTTRRNHESVCWLYSDNPNVSVYTLYWDGDPYNEQEGIAYNYPGEVLRLGTIFGGDTGGHQWDKAFYYMARLNFEERKRSFYVPESPTALNPPDYPYQFVHHDQNRDFRIDFNRINKELPVIMPEGSNNIFDYLPIIMAAQEVHVIDSCLLCLAECADFRRKVFYHTYARHGGQEPIVKNPNIIRV